MTKQTDDAIHKALQPYQRRIAMLLAELDQKDQIIEQQRQQLHAYEKFERNRITNESRQ